MKVNKFQNMYLVSMGIVNGTYGKEEIEEGKPVLKPFVKLGTPLWYAAKRFMEKNENNFKKIDSETKDIGYNLALQDKDTKEILFNTHRSHGPHEFRFEKENLKKYEKEIREYYSKDVEFEIEKHICPTEKLPDPIPFELEILNGFILEHNFYEEC